MRKLDVQFVTFALSLNGVIFKIEILFMPQSHSRILLDVIGHLKQYLIIWEHIIIHMVDLTREILSHSTQDHLIMVVHENKSYATLFPNNRPEQQLFIVAVEKNRITCDAESQCSPCVNDVHDPSPRNLDVN